MTSTALAQPQSSPQTLLELEGAGLTFPNGVRALGDVTEQIEPGDFVSIVGPSGCGKSTLLRIVAGLLRPSQGAVRIGGLDSVEARRRRRNVAFVFQSATLLPWRTVEKNVRLPLELQGRSKSESRDAVSAVLDLVGLHDFRRAYPHQLSGGMQMRVSLARALVIRPALLLLDEPFGALDDITRQRLNEELLALWERDRFTAIFVTHNVSEAVFLSERVLVMSSRPGRFLARHDVPFSHPRQPDLRNDAEFARLCGEIGAGLRMSFQ